MALLEVPSVDVVADSISKILTQYKESDLVTFVTIFAEQLAELEEVNTDVLLLRRLENATGAQLDVLGTIVGTTRYITALGVVEEIFQVSEDGSSFDDFQVDADGDGDFTNFYVNLEVDSTTENRIPLDDDTFRRVIYTKIIRNYSDCTINDMINACQTLLGDTSTSVQVIENYRHRYFFGNTGSEIFQVAEDGSTLEDFEVDSSGLGIYSEFSVNVDPQSILGYATLPAAISLEDFNFVMDIEVAENEIEGVLLGSNSSTNEGYIEFNNLDADNQVFDLYVNLGDVTTTIAGVLPSDRRTVLEVERVSTTLTVKVDTVEVYSGTVLDDVWDFAWLGNTSSLDVEFQGTWYQMTMAYQGLEQDYVLWTFRDQTDSFAPKFLSKTPPPIESENEHDASVYTFTIQNYDEDFWLTPELSYTVKVYKELSLTEKSLLKENYLLPNTAVVPVTYADINGEF